MIRDLAPTELLLLPESAAASRDATVEACIAAGFPVDTLDEFEATALHHAALHGRIAPVRVLLAHGAALEIRDKEHSATPLGWALFGADVLEDEGAEYPAVVRALLDAGATVEPRHKQRVDSMLNE
jgi:ankyrin repeat protein